MSGGEKSRKLFLKVANACSFPSVMILRIKLMKLKIRTPGDVGSITPGWITRVCSEKKD